MALLAVPGLAAAQSYDNPGLGEQPVVAHPQDYKPLGFRAGGFMLHPGVQLAARYTDNVFYTSDAAESGKQSDTIFHIRPYITAQSTWSRHSLNVRLAADIARHQDYGFRDYEDYFLMVNGRIDVRNRSYMTYTLDAMQLHEGLNVRSAEQGIEPTVYQLYGGSLGYDHAFNRLSLGILGDWRHLDFDDVLAEDGSIIDNQDRDRDESSLRLRAAYQFQTDKQLFASVSSRNVSFDQPIDRNGYYRDSSGWSADAGLSFTVTGKMQGDLSVGYREMSYDDPLLPDVTGWSLGASLSWMPTQMTSVHGRITSSIQPTTDANSSGFFMTLYSLRLDHELTRSLQLSGFLSYRVNDYQLIEGAPENAREKDDAWQAGLGLNYYINRNMFLSANYTYQTLDSNVALDEYGVNSFWATFSLEY